MCFITYNISGVKSKELVKLFEVEYYEKSDGTYPAEEFILSQDIKMQTKLFRLLELLELKGNELREPYSKSLSDGIFEIRAIQGNNITRVLYFFVVDKKIILTNGFVKKTQKTPENEIVLAKKYRKDYELRKGNL
ncbi:MAG: type II toxin-antitoxin system RelE/ParE family toxin [Clostridia bacterium]|nr:type II toxin-antitoxin system RelE/ParE family toxin [Clostridia bacterium]